MKIAVFGGSFNPFHIGHAMLADSVINELGYDKVLFHFQNEKLKTMQSYFKGLVIRKKEYGVLKYQNEK